MPRVKQANPRRVPPKQPLAKPAIKLRRPVSLVPFAKRRLGPRGRIPPPKPRYAPDAGPDRPESPPPLRQKVTGSALPWAGPDLDLPGHALAQRDYAAPMDFDFADLMALPGASLSRATPTESFGIAFVSLAAAVAAAVVACIKHSRYSVYCAGNGGEAPFRAAPRGQEGLAGSPAGAC